MKKSLSFALFLSLYSILFTQYSFAQTKSKVHVTFTNQYCGGARPTPEIEEEYNKPKNLSGFTILLEGKKHFKIKTDSTGSFSKALKPGVYKIYLSSKINTKFYTNYSPACDKMLHTPYGKLVVEKGKTGYELNLYFPCNPCELPRP